MAKYKNVDEIVRFIESNNLSTDECSSIFRALMKKESIIGGKIWTRDDIRSAIENKLPENLDISEDAISEVQNALNEDALNDCTDSEWEAITDSISDSEGAVKVTGIKWDFDDITPEEADLPTEENIQLSSLEEYDGQKEIPDYLSDEYGYCVLGYSACL